MILELLMFAAFVAIGLLRMYVLTPTDKSPGAAPLQRRHVFCGFDHSERPVLSDPDGTPVQ